MNIVPFPLSSNIVPLSAKLFLQINFTLTLELVKRVVISMFSKNILTKCIKCATVEIFNNVNIYKHLLLLMSLKIAVLILALHFPVK